MSYAVYSFVAFPWNLVVISQGKPENGWVSPLGLKGMGQGKAQVRVCTEEEAAEFYIQHQWMMPGEAEEKAACLYEDGFRQMEYTAEHDFGNGNTVVAGTRVLCGVSQGIPFFEEVLLSRRKGRMKREALMRTMFSQRFPRINSPCKFGLEERMRW